MPDINRKPRECLNRAERQTNKERIKFYIYFNFFSFIYYYWFLLLCFCKPENLYFFLFYFSEFSFGLISSFFCKAREHAPVIALW